MVTFAIAFISRYSFRRLSSSIYLLFLRYFYILCSSSFCLLFFNFSHGVGGSAVGISDTAVRACCAVAPAVGGVLDVDPFPSATLNSRKVRDMGRVAKEKT